MLTIFLICAFLVFWAYFGYPLSMWALAHIKSMGGEELELSTDVPHVSVIIAVFNSADTIYEKLCNTFDTSYPSSMVEVIVVLDGYCEKTLNQIDLYMANYPANYVTKFVAPRGGKEAAQKRGIDLACGDIVVFTDVATMIDRDTIYHLVEHFANPNIGAVDGLSQVVSDGHSNEGLYLKYENKIREWESATSGLVGTGGCLFAARKDILKQRKGRYEAFVTDMQSDFRTALVMRTWGLKTVLDRKAIAKFKDGKESKEFSRKHRTLVRGYNVLLHNLHLLNPFKYGLFSYALFCHKVLKWTVPFFLIGAFFSNGHLAYNVVTQEYSAFWTLVYIAQTAFYILSFNHYENKYGKIVHFFVMTNIAILVAWYSYIRGERFVFWEPTKR